MTPEELRAIKERDARCIEVGDHVIFGGSLGDAAKDRRALLAEVEALEWLWANCKIVYWPGDGSYPVEHVPGAGKYNRDEIERAFLAAREKTT